MELTDVSGILSAFPPPASKWMLLRPVLPPPRYILSAVLVLVRQVSTLRVELAVPLGSMTFLWSGMFYNELFHNSSASMERWRLWVIWYRGVKLIWPCCHGPCMWSWSSAHCMQSVDQICTQGQHWGPDCGALWAWGLELWHPWLSEFSLSMFIWTGQMNIWKGLLWNILTWYKPKKKRVLLY